jgi:hypothetical protein
MMAAAATRELEKATSHAMPAQGRSNEVAETPEAAGLKGRIWVTRRGVRIDRIASAWLIRRWIDPDANFRFVAAPNYQPREREVRFDMFEAEFTHENGNDDDESRIGRGAAMLDDLYRFFNSSPA